jgi:phosphoribosylformylglycinamidine synthase
MLATLNATDFVGVQFTNDDATWSGTLASVREDTSSISILQPDGTPSTATVTMRTLRFRQCNGFVRPDDRIVATAEGETISASVYQTEIKPWNAEEVFIGETRALEPIVFAGTTIPANGDAAGFEIGEGIIFQKGQFSKVFGQFIIVNPSSRDLSDYTVGFTSVEEVITEFVDESLYDNAFFEGGNNLNAPGAHRLKVTPKLIAVKKSEISQLPEGSEYLPLFEFNERGDITIKRTDPQYAALGNELARRTWEESGNYVVNDLFATISDVDLDKGTFKYTITPGIAYINGKRVEVLAPTEFESSMGTDLSSEQLLSTSMSSLYTRTNSGARAYDSIELYSTQNSRTVFAPGKTFTDATAVFIKQANTATVNSLLGTGTFALPATIDSSNTTHIGLVLNNVTGPSGVSAYSAPAGAANYTLPVEWVVGTTSPGSAVIGPSDTVLYFVGEDADDDGTFPVIGAAIGYVRYHGADSQVGTPLFTRRIDGTVVDIGGDAMDAPGYDLLGLVVGSEGQLGVVTEATVRILPLAEGARPVLFGFDTSEQAGAAVAHAWHADMALPGGTDLVVLPGGFSYGDYLRTGAIAARAPIMDAVRSHSARGGLVLAICNGFQIACEAGLLPGVLVRNANLRFACKRQHLKVERCDTAFTRAYAPGQVIDVCIAHGEGNYICDAGTLARLENKGLVAFRYCDAEGQVTVAANPNGSLNGIAGIYSESLNVLGMMPHPENLIEHLTGGIDGKGLFDSLLGRSRAA